MAEPFYAARATHDPRRFTLEVGAAHVVGPAEWQFLMGGVGLGSAITALEAATGRPLVWATAQYLSYAAPGDVVDIDVDIPVEGKRVTQARVISKVGEREIITVNAALGERADDRAVQFATMPELPGAETVPLLPSEHPSTRSLHDVVERRRIEDPAAEAAGRSRTWMRAGDEPVSAGLLAVLADHLPGALPETRGSSSLDNTLRIRALKPTRWCLLDTQIHGFAKGFFHGEMQVYAEDGTLLATASQSGSLPRDPVSWSR